MNSIKILRYFKYFLSMMQNMEKQNKNHNNPEKSKKLSIFIPPLKDFILIIDESKINYTDYKNSKFLDIKLYYVTYMDRFKWCQFEKFTEDLQKSEQIISFDDYLYNENFWLRRDIVIKPHFNQEGYCEPFRINKGHHDAEDFSIYVDEVKNMIYYSYLNEVWYYSPIRQNKNFENLVEWIDA